MLVPKVSMKEFKKIGFKECKIPYKNCYYLCVARGIKMIFVSPEIVAIIDWEDTDNRIHKRANCKYSDNRTAEEILCEMILKGMVTCDYIKEKKC